MAIPRRTGHDIADLLAKSGQGSRDTLGVQSGISNIYRYTERSTFGTNGVMTFFFETGAALTTIKRIEILSNQPIHGEWKIEEASAYNSHSSRGALKNIDASSSIAPLGKMFFAASYTQSNANVFFTEYFGDGIARNATRLVDSSTVDCYRLAANKKYVIRITLSSEFIEPNCAFSFTFLEERI